METTMGIPKLELKGEPLSMESLDDIVQKGVGALQQGALKRAESLFQLVADCETTPQATIGLAVVLMRLREWGKALESLRQILRRGHIKAESLQHLRFAIALCFSGMGRHAQARKALDAALSGNPNDVEALCAMADLEVLLAEDHIGRCNEYLNKARECDPDHAVLKSKLADRAFNAGSIDEAREFLAEAIVSAKSQGLKADLLFQIGRLHHTKGEYDAAYQEYRKAKALCQKLKQPVGVHLLFAFAQTCVITGHLEEATKALEECREQDNSHAEVFKLLTYVYLKREMVSKAAECVSTCVTMVPDDCDAWTLYIEAFKGSTQAQKAHEKLNQISSNSASGSEADGLSEASAQTWNNLGTIRFDQGDHDGAKAAYRKGQERILEQMQQPGLTDDERKDLQVAKLIINFNMAVLAENAMDMQTAVEQYLATCEQHSWFAEGLLMMGRQYESIGDSHRALEAYQEAAKLNPVVGCLMMAELHRNRGDYTRALASAAVAQKTCGNKESLYNQIYRGNLYFERAHEQLPSSRDKERYLHEARGCYVQALMKQQDCFRAVNGIGMICAAEGNMQMARRIFHSVSEHMGEDPAVNINLGHTYWHLGGFKNIQKAIKYYETALKLKPESCEIRECLAQATFHVKQHITAINLITDALNVFPDNLFLRYNLARITEKYGRNLVEEEEMTQRYVGLDIGIEKLEQAKQHLNAAMKQYLYIHDRWKMMSDHDRKAMASRAPQSVSVKNEMRDVPMRREFCVLKLTAAEHEIERQKQEKLKQESQIRQISEAKKQKQHQEAEEKEQIDKEENERGIEMEEQALRLMESGKTIGLGKNLESLKDTKSMQRPQKRKPDEEDRRAAKAAKKSSSSSSQQLPEPEGSQAEGAVPGAEDEAFIGREDEGQALEKADIDEEEELFGQFDDDEPRRKGKKKKDKKEKKHDKEKKEKKEKTEEEKLAKEEKKKDKKEKKKEKKDKKRAAREEAFLEGSPDDDDVGDDDDKLEEPF